MFEGESIILNKANEKEQIRFKRPFSKEAGKRDINKKHFKINSARTKIKMRLITRETTLK